MTARRGQKAISEMERSAKALGVELGRVLEGQLREIARLQKEVLQLAAENARLIAERARLQKDREQVRRAYMLLGGWLDDDETSAPSELPAPPGGNVSTPEAEEETSAPPPPEAPAPKQADLSRQVRLEDLLRVLHERGERMTTREIGAVVGVRSKVITPRLFSASRATEARVTMHKREGKGAQWSLTAWGRAALGIHEHPLPEGRSIIDHLLIMLKMCGGEASSRKLTLLTGLTGSQVNNGLGNALNALHPKVERVGPGAWRLVKEDPGPDPRPKTPPAPLPAPASVQPDRPGAERLLEYMASRPWVVPGEVAMKLRMSPEEVEARLASMEETGAVQVEGGRWRLASVRRVEPRTVRIPARPGDETILIREDEDDPESPCLGQVVRVKSRGVAGWGLLIDDELVDNWWPTPQAAARACRRLTLGEAGGEEANSDRGDNSDGATREEGAMEAAP